MEIALFHRHLICCCFGTIFVSASANADGWKLDRTAYAFGTIALDAEEIVWDTDFGGEANNERLSQLNWNTYWAPTFSANAQLSYGDKLGVEFQTRFAITGDSFMSDYDWLYYHSTDEDSWSHRSYSDDTRLKYYYELGANIHRDFELEDSGIKLSPALGFNFTNLRWKAYGGEYVYSIDDFRDSEGEFPDDEAGIAYRMRYLTPYIGLTLSRQFGDYSLSATGKYGRSLRADVFDQHFVRDLEISANAPSLHYLSAEIELRRAINENFDVFASLDWQHFERQTMTSHYKYKYEPDFDYPDGAAAALDTSSLSFGTVYKF